MKAVIKAKKFVWARATKNTHRYEEVVDGGDAVIGTVYIQKTAVEAKENGKTTAPAEIWLTIEVE